MSHLKSIERLSCILKYVHSVHYPTFEEIIKELERQEVYTTERTLQRDFKTLRDTCFIEIKYNRFQRGYFIDEDYNKDFKDWMHVFEIFNKAKVINEILLKDSSSIEYIDFDRQEQTANEQYFDVLLRAIMERKQLKIIYQSYLSDEPIELQLCPYLLKQYQNRWYIFGTNNENINRSYGLERISKIEVLDTRFKSKIKDPKSLFNDIVGINFAESERVKVILSYDSFQGNYIKSQPLHPKQKILIDNEKEFRIELNIRPNYELEEQLLKQAEKVVVIEPKWLKE
ncbi:MAG: WYL domain-containing protein, partial [Crocinitomicaceae bacterium]|nr:WYL domain-containing protein [Crocinitomicaceae bacterium]